MPKKYIHSRRSFLTQSSLSAAGFLLSAPAFSQRFSSPQPALFQQLDELSPLGEADANGIRLPAGFQSRLIATSGQPVTPASDYLWHPAPDGGACFALVDNGWIYVSNSEIEDGLGGVGAIRFDAAGNVIDAYPILQGTNVNCAGGKTPWNTWLSCEEVEGGLVYECDPTGAVPAVARPALGRFVHEAVAVDPVRGCLYLTEDEPDGGFYRFIPARPLPDLSAGRLEIAEVIEANGQAVILWHAVPDPSAARRRTRHQLRHSSPFNGGEGIAWSAGKVYFTTKGDNRVWIYDTDTAHLDILYDAGNCATPELTGVDNVTITASGDVLVAEDGGDMQIVLLAFDGRPIPILQVTGQEESEICGPAFDPSFQRLYFSSQTGPANRDEDGRIYEISRVTG